jgi:hypothetical protein
LARQLRPLFLLTDLMTDQAEFELLQRRRPMDEWCELPAPQDSPPSPPQGPVAYPELERLVTQLQSDERPTLPLTEVVPWGSYEESAYRMSMLSLLGDAEAAGSGGLVADLAALPYALTVRHERATVRRAGVASMSQGQLQRSSSASLQTSAEAVEGDKEEEPPHVP